MPYRLNGNLLTMPEEAGQDATAPTAHSTNETEIALHDTIGGKIAVEPPTGTIRVHTWHYDKRTTTAFHLLLSYIGSNRMCFIDTYEHQRDELGDDVLLEDLQVIVQIPNRKSAGSRRWVDSFDLVFTEMMAQ